MRAMRHLLVLQTPVVALFLVVSSRAALAYVPPPLAGAVTDTAGKLSVEDDKALEASLATYRARTGNEIAVLVVGSLGTDTIETVAYTAFNTWGIGKAGKDNGVLLVIAPNERKTRIETGKGVGAELTDVQSFHILHDRVQPLLKKEQFRPAIEAGVEAIEAALDQREPPPIPEAARATTSTGELIIMWTAGTVGVLAFGLLVFTFFYSLRQRRKGQAAAAAAGVSYEAFRSSGSSSSDTSYSSGSSGGGGGYSGGGGSSGGGGASDSY